MDYLEKKYKKSLEEIKVIYLNKSLVKLKNFLSAIPKYVHNFIDIFIKKSLIQEEKYDYMEDPTKFVLPKDTNILESERDKIIYRRMVALKNAYIYQSTKLETTSNLTEEFLENTRKLLEIFTFSNLKSQNANTKIFKELLDLVYENSNEDVTNIVSLNQKLLVENHQEVQKLLEDLTRFNRLAYKLTFRFDVYPQLPSNIFTKELYIENAKDYVKRLKEYIRHEIPEFPFIEYYINGAIKDVYNADVDQEIEKLKSMYLSGKESKAVALSPKDHIITTLKLTNQLIPLLEDLSFMLTSNHRQYKKNSLSFFGFIISLIKRFFFIQTPEQPLKIKYYDPKLKRYVEKYILFNDFMDNMRLLIQNLIKLNDKNSPFLEKLFKSTVQDLAKYLNNLYMDIYSVKEIINGVENEFLTALKIKFIGEIMFEETKEVLENVLTTMYEKQKSLLGRFRSK